MREQAYRIKKEADEIPFTRSPVIIIEHTDRGWILLIVYILNKFLSVGLY